MKDEIKCLIIVLLMLMIFVAMVAYGIGESNAVVYKATEISGRHYIIKKVSEKEYYEYKATIVGKELHDAKF